jgi:hypothetical protein
MADCLRNFARRCLASYTSQGPSPSDMPKQQSTGEKEKNPASFPSIRS